MESYTKYEDMYIQSHELNYNATDHLILKTLE
jgi:hypothetical protein